MATSATPTGVRDTREPVRVLESAEVRGALADFPAGVVLVTTGTTPTGWQGFTASSFCGVSLSPPIVSTCLDRSANCYPAFLQTSRFCVSLLRENQAPLAARFATKGGDKFAGTRFMTDRYGLPYVAGARWAMSCELLTRSGIGDHEVLFGKVTAIHSAEPSDDADPLVYWRRSFTRLSQ